MFLPFDAPLAGRKTLHQRSKTITVLVNQQKKSSVSLSHQKPLSSKKNHQSTQIIRYHQHTGSEPEDTKQFVSLRKLTEQIQRLINRQLCYPQLLTHVERGSGRRQADQTQNPQRNEFADTTYIQRPNPSLQTHPAGFREPQYLTLLKRTQRLNAKSFIPHFNWREKLTRLKNMGNYGQVFKKKSEKISLKKFETLPTKQESNYDHVIDSTKVTIDPQIIISRGIHQPKYHRKGSTCRRCHTSSTDYPQDNNDRKQNQTCLYGEKLLSRKKSQNKSVYDDRFNRFGKLSERDWKFQPWDVKKDY